MRKVRTRNELQELLDNDHAWRIKEIAALKIFVKKTGIVKTETSLRAAVPLLYAHWEGFVKHSSINYLSFVNSRSLEYEKLQSCFVVFGMKGKLNEVEHSKKTQVSIAALDFIRDELSNKSKMAIESAIRTDSNLGSVVFENIALSIGLDTARYQAKYKLIDESLVSRRNKIAHGEYLDIEVEGFRSLADEVLTLLRTYKTDIENAVSLESYLKQ